MDFGTIFSNPMAIFGLIAVAICGIGLFVWFFWEKLKNKLKGPEKIPCQIMSKGPVVAECNLLVDNIFYLSNEATMEAWAYHPDAVQYKEDGNIAGILLTHDSCVPQFPGKNLDYERMHDELKKEIRPKTLAQFHNAYEAEIRRNASSPLAEWMGLAVILVVGGVLVMVIVMLLTSDLMPW